MYSPCVDIGRHLHGLRLDIVDRVVLLLDEHGHVLEHLRELGHGALNLGNLDLTLLDLTVGSAGGSVAVRVEHCLREHLGVAAFNDILDLLRGCVGLDNLELTLDTVPSLLAVLLLNRLVLLQKVAETEVGGFGLALLLLVALCELGQVLDRGRAVLARNACLLGKLVGVGGSVGVGRVLLLAQVQHVQRLTRLCWCALRTAWILASRSLSFAVVAVCSLQKSLPPAEYWSCWPYAFITGEYWPLRPGGYWVPPPPAACAYGLS